MMSAQPASDCKSGFRRACFGLWISPVKALSVLIAMAVSPLAAADDPGRAAVGFLEKVRDGSANLAPGEDTAISPAASAKKRAEIARRLERLARDLGGTPLEAGPVKVDGEFAAALVRKTGGFDPGRMQVFPIALVRRGEDWMPAPVPASFENTGIGYSPDVRQRTRALEDWMLRERFLDLETMRSQAAQRMRLSISRTLPPQKLKSLDSRQVAERFLGACARHDLPEVLGLLGGLSDSLPDDWSLRLRTAETALALPAETPRPWRLLVSDQVLRLIVEHDENAINGPAMVTVACLDPAGRPPHGRSPAIEPIHLELIKSSDGFWRVDPPPSFLLPPGSGEEDEMEDPLDAGLVENFRRALASGYPAAPHASAAAARDAVLTALRDTRPFAWLPLIELPRDPQDACCRAARLWWELHQPRAALHPVPLAFQESGDAAALACLLFDARHPERFDVRFLFFSKSQAGWLWQPAPAGKVRGTFGEWTSRQSDHWKDAWRDALLADSPVIAPPLADHAPQETQTRSLMDAWFQAVRSGAVADALRLTARLNLPDSMEALLRNLGYEIAGLDAASSPPVITDIQAVDGLSMVAVKTESRGETRHPVFPVVQTPAGLRILLEADLAASGGRTRDFLNKSNLERLGGFDAATASKFSELFRKIQIPAVETAPQP